MIMKRLLFLCLITTCLYADENGRVQRIYGLYSAERLSPKLNYPHNATNNWFDSVTVMQPPLGQLIRVESSTEADVARFGWEYSTPETKASGMVHVRKGGAFDQAVRLLMLHYSLCSAPQPFPRAAGLCTNIGDVCYTGYPAGSAKCIDFIRNNIYVSISSTDESWSTNTAFSIDAAILNASTNALSGSN